MALGPRAGQKVLSLQSVASPDKSSTPDLCAKLHGFSLHAVRWVADQSNELEHLSRYITYRDRQQTAYDFQKQQLALSN